MNLGDLLQKKLFGLFQQKMTYLIVKHHFFFQLWKIANHEFLSKEVFRLVSAVSLNGGEKKVGQ